MPMTAPLTFSSALSAYDRTKDDPNGVRCRVADREIDAVARGS
jgi:hypothetical protein